MTLRDLLDAEPVSRRRKDHPKGWAPGYDDSGDAITLTAAIHHPPQADTWRELLKAEGYDPDLYHVDESNGVQHRKWQQSEGGEFLRYFRFTAVKNTAKRAHVGDLIARVGKRPPLKPKQYDGSVGLVVNLSDWQAGSPHGGGHQPLLERINHLGPAVVQRWRELRKMGVPLDTLYVHSLGDMGESCDGHYPQQAFRTTLTNEEQREFVIHGIDTLLDQWVGLAPKVAVYGIPGNHGEYRTNGKSVTDFRDNVDTGVWVNIAHAYSKNPERYGHVQIHLPKGQDLDMSYDHEGYITALIHGHQAKGGGDPGKKINTWWRGQMEGQRPAGDADLLVSGHYHHFRAVQQGPRCHLMAPALCAAQDWWTQMSGLDSPPATLTYTVSSDGWDDMKLLTPGG